MNKGRCNMMESRRKEVFILNLNRKAQDLYNNENTIESLLLFQRAEILLKEYPIVKLQLLTFNNMATYYLKQNNLELSMDYLAYCSRLQPTDLSSFIFQIGSLINLSALKSKCNKHKEALSCALKALNLLEDYPNECLNIICYYTIALEYIHLNQIRPSEEYFHTGYKASYKFFGSDHFLSQNFAELRGYYLAGTESFNEICILGGNFPQIRRRSIGQVSKRKASIDVEKTENITITTTPWLEHDEWKVVYIDQRFTQKFKKQLSPYPEPSKSVCLNSGLLDKIDSIIKKSKKVLIVNEKKRPKERTVAAIKIQRAFRRFLQSKRSVKKMKFNQASFKKMDFDKTDDRSKRTKSEFKGKNVRSKYREFVDIRFKGFRKEDLS